MVFQMASDGRFGALLLCGIALGFELPPREKLVNNEKLF